MFSRFKKTIILFLVCVSVIFTCYGCKLKYVAVSETKLDEAYNLYYEDCLDGVIDTESAYSHLNNENYDTEGGVVVDEIIEKENVLLIDQSTSKYYIYKDGTWYYIKNANSKNINYEASTGKYISQSNFHASLSQTYLVYLNYRIYRIS